MTAEEREALAAAQPEHQSWCHGEAHAECCGAGDCDCGVADSLDRLLPVVDAIARRRAAEELRAIVIDAVIVGEVMHERGPIRVPVTYLDERADALEAE